MAHRWIGKQNVVYTYNIILLRLKKEWNSDTYYSVDEPWRHYAKWDKPDTEGQILYDSIYMSASSNHHSTFCLYEFDYSRHSCK